MRSALILCLGLLGCPAGAETRQHGNMIFDIPTGWATGAVRDDGSLTLYSDLPKDECQFCYIYIAPSMPVSIAPDRWLTAQAKRFVDTDEVDTPQVEVVQAAEPTGLKGYEAAMLVQRVDGDMQVLVAVRLSGQMELVGFQTQSYDDEDLAEGLAVLQRDFLPMLEKARFVSEGAASLMPAPQPGDLSGVYWGTYTWWTVGMDGLMQMQIDHRWLTFWPDGTFYDGTPPEGLTGFDPAARLAQGDMEWGSYRLSGMDLTLTYVSGEVEAITLDEDGLQTDTSVLSRVEPLADGTKITGMVSTFYFSGFAGMTGGVSQATDTKFRPDGTWAFTSSGGAFGSFDGGGYATSNENFAAGKYEVKDGLVIRYGEDGVLVGQEVIFKAGDTLWIGSELLEPG